MTKALENALKEWLRKGHQVQIYYSCGEFKASEAGNPGKPQGSGPTPDKALADLAEQL